MKDNVFVYSIGWSLVGILIGFFIIGVIGGVTFLFKGCPAGFRTVQIYPQALQTFGTGENPGL